MQTMDTNFMEVNQGEISLLVTVTEQWFILPGIIMQSLWFNNTIPVSERIVQALKMGKRQSFWGVLGDMQWVLYGLSDSIVGGTFN